MDLRPTSNAAATAKIGNPKGCFLAEAWLRCSCHRALAMLLRRALPAARQKTARPFLILKQALIQECVCIVLSSD